MTPGYPDVRSVTDVLPVRHRRTTPQETFPFTPDSQGMNDGQRRGHPSDPSMEEIQVGKRPATNIEQDIVSGRRDPKKWEVPDGHDT